MEQTTFPPATTIDFEKSHIRATDPALCAGMTTVSPREHFRISSEAFASLSKSLPILEDSKPKLAELVWESALQLVLVR